MHNNTSNKRPHIVLVVARGEAVRNFLYSDTLPSLAEKADVTLLSLVDHGEVIERVKPYVRRVIPLKRYRENALVAFFRNVLHTAHYRWLWSEAVKYYWGRHNERVKGNAYETAKLVASRVLALPWANPLMLRLGTKIERWLSWKFRPTKDFDMLFSEIKPDLVFNCSHIHGPHADLPLRVAKGMGIKTAAFVFSWDNLTSRSRIFVPYDYYLMWTNGMKKQLLELYPELQPDHVFVTGTPQFDFHFKPEFCISREELSQRIGLDPKRPYILYTTGKDADFPDEYKFVKTVIKILQNTDLDDKVQLVVRTYIKGTSSELQALSEQKTQNVVFPPILWDQKWIMPLYEDLAIYSSLLYHCELGINAASTVTLEMMMLDKPVINIGMEPPGSNLPHYSRFSRHVDYEHFRPVVKSGGVMVARSEDDLRKMIYEGLKNPKALHNQRKQFIRKMFSDTLDGYSGQRVADVLLRIAQK